MIKENDKYDKISKSVNLFRETGILSLKTEFGTINSYDCAYPILLRLESYFTKQILY